MTPSVKQISNAEYKKMDWKNGGGTTHEIAIWPPHSSISKSDFLWRLSSAKVLADGPFSLFEEHDRSLTLIDGQKLQLDRESGASQTLLPGEVFQFSGKERISCQLPAGPVTDLNLIYNRRSIQSTFDLLSIGVKPRSFQLDGQKTLLYAIEGQLCVTLYPGETSFKLNAGDTLLIDSSPRPQKLSQDGTDSLPRVSDLSTEASETMILISCTLSGQVALIEISDRLTP
jgi:environmental stress-induced protein Ves